MTEYLLYLYAESPVHTGAADSADVLDLPVQREAATGYPVIWGQSLKGALRQAAGDADWVETVFGSAIQSPDENGGTTEGGLAVGDAQLVAMPVPTLRSTFAWMTTEIALGRLARKLRRLGVRVASVPGSRPGAGAAASAVWTSAADEVLGPCLVSLGRSPDSGLAAWAGRIADDVLTWDDVFAPFDGKFRTDLLLVGSDVAPVLLSECTEQAVRVQLDPKSKKVRNGPFYSEYLPAETIMAASLTLRDDADDDANRSALLGLLDKQLLRIGGDETLGKGLMWARLHQGAAA
jgi:CRISPR-associated protein Cmr4